MKTIFPLAIAVLIALPGCSAPDGEEVTSKNDAGTIAMHDAAPDGKVTQDTGASQDTAEVKQDTGPPPQLCTEDSDCADKGGCNKVKCVPQEGKPLGHCIYVIIAKGQPCDDNDKCTTGETCDDKQQCVGGEATKCDDLNPCTKDSCDPKKGCQVEKLTGDNCDDGDICTVGDKCTKGVCKKGKKKECDEKQCQKWQCLPDEGCTYTYQPGKCDDNDKCTEGDHCDNQQGKVVCVAGGKLDCDDKNICTKDTCHVVDGCDYSAANEGQKCDDGNACTSNTACKNGGCQGGTAKKCDDKNSCTEDSCAADGSWVFNKKAKAGDKCEDGSKCTINDVCDANGQCIGDKIPCNDGNDCTEDLCNKATGKCAFNPTDTATCSDGNKCTNPDKCKGGACISQPKNCNDNQECTQDICNQQTGNCQFDYSGFEGKECNDNNPCTQLTKCKQGKCTGVQSICNDKNPCTKDACKIATGKCEYEKLANGVTCDDNKLCTESDTCKSGKCIGKPKTCSGNGSNKCTIQACDPTDGFCKPKTKTCDDKNQCTVDSCNQGTGKCEHKKLNTNICDDGDPCTTGDSCVNGVCKHIKLLCDDGKPCTKDICDPNAAGNKCNNVCVEGMKLPDGTTCACPPAAP